MQSDNQWLQQVKWNSDNLVAAIVQDYSSQRVLMMAWMNRQSLQLTIDEGHAVYWSRSRNKLWRKGEVSGHIQIVHDVRLDCDNDAILLQVTQVGGVACHTGREHCFYKSLRNNNWLTVEPIIKNPDKIYNK